LIRWLTDTLALHGARKPVASTRQCFDETDPTGGTPQGLAHAVDDCVQPLIEIDHSVVGPQAPAQLLARYELPGSLEECCERHKGLIGKRNSLALLEKLSGFQIGLEGSEPDSTRGVTLLRHMRKI
jgi:hypothetical protein